jgi:hypothetical protein
MNADSRRWRSQYCHVLPEIPFTAHDALALALLRGTSTRDPFVNTYIEAAWKALITGLDLPHAEEVSKLLRGETFQSSLFERFEKIAFRSALHLRQAVIALASVGGALEGDPWGGDLIRPSFRPPLEAARNWHHSQWPALEEGLRLADVAICHMVQWDVERTIDFARLRDLGWPALTSDEIFDHWY